ncbi:MAG: response regulator transcription factor [Anaerolineales bacterium]|nr:response regulator transcription factor [Anaerolineales bacterium]
MDPIRILLADDHAVVRRGLVLVLRQEPDFVVVGEAQDGQEAVSMALALIPDLVLLDWKMPRLSGLQAAAEIKRNLATARTLILSGAPVEDAALDALDQGVDGFVHKDISPAGLAQAIRAVAAGQRYLGPEITQALIERSQREPDSFAPPVSLSPREVEVLALMASSATYREIGAQLFISEETVRTHVKRILTKLGQPNRTQAVIAAMRLGLLELGDSDGG